MTVEQRPYVGSWTLNNKKVVQHTPDCLVYINGDLTVPGSNLRGEQRAIPVNEYITSVSVDNGTEPGSLSSTISLSIPVHALDSVVRDAQFIFRPGLEVHVYMRGYFPVRGLFREQSDDGGQVPVFDDEGNFIGFQDVTDEGIADTTFKDAAGDETGGFENQQTYDDVGSLISSIPGSDRQQNAWLIYESFTNAGYSNAIALAAVVNSYGESGLDANAVNDKSGAVGLFQLLPDGGAGAADPAFKEGRTAGTTNQTEYNAEEDYYYDAQDAQTNTDRILMEMGRYGDALVEADKNGASMSELIGLFAQNIERLNSTPGTGNCGDGLSELECATNHRVGVAENWWGDEFVQGSSPNTGIVVEPGEAGVNDYEGRGWHSKQAWDDLLAYPYYPVFHGVVTSVDFAYSGGFQTATISCSSLLHFWSYQSMSTNASLFGARPNNSKLKMSFRGHNYTGSHPFEIIYSLFHDTAGAAGGVSWALSQKTNVDANVQGQSMFTLALEYWRKRFSTRVNSLRMHGISGELFNSAQAAFLGRLSTGEAEVLFPSKGNVKAAEGILKASKTLGLVDPRKVPTYDKDQAVTGQDNTFQEGAIEMNVFSMIPFLNDITQYANINLFESSYETKMDIAQKVCEVTNFEFFQDSDGDFVFKPHFYNLDTSASRVYRIEDIDIININFGEKEPIATYVTCSAGQYGSTVTGATEGEWGVKGTYIDYRLVAQFGWRPQAFETNYKTNPRDLFFMAVNFLDVLNIDRTSASVTVPLRPEIRVGYPFYISYLDCFYYCNSFSHSYQVGSDCTTTLQLQGKRAKFFAPGDVGSEVGGIDSVRLNDLTFPPKPLQVYDDENAPKLSGFPNVVMALDPDHINPMNLIAGADFTDITNPRTLRVMLYYAAQERGDISGPDTYGYYSYKGDLYGGSEVKMYVKTGSDDIGFQNTEEGFLGGIDLVAIAQQYVQNQAQGNEGVTADDEAIQLLLAITQWASGWLAQGALSGWDNPNSSANLLDLLSEQKAIFTNGSLPGYYRYFSQSHPDPEHQGRAFSMDEFGDIVDDAGLASEGEFPQDGEIYTMNPSSPEDGLRTPEAELVETTGGVKQGLYVELAGEVRETVPTGEITAIAFQIHPATVSIRNYTPNIAVERTYRSGDVGAGVSKVAKAQYEKADPETFEAHLDDQIGEFFQPIVDYLNGLVDSVASDGVPPFVNPSTLEAASSVHMTFREYQEFGGGLGRSFTTQQTFDTAFRDWSWYLDQSFTTDWEASNKEALKAENTGKVKRMNKQLALFATPTLSSKPLETPIKQAKEYVSPVFPISDASGHEVIGTYSYGRGLDVIANNPFDQLLQADPFRAVDPQTVDTFIRAVFLGQTGVEEEFETEDGKIEKVTVEFNAKDAWNNMVQDLAGNLSDQQLLDFGLAQLNENKTAFQLNLMNWFADQGRDGTQKLPIENSAFSLADLGFHEGNFPSATAHRGAEADVDLGQAFAMSFVEVAQTQDISMAETYANLEFNDEGDPVMDDASVFQALEIGRRTDDWKRSQEAVRGKALENREPSTEQEWQAILDRFTNNRGEG